MEEASRCRTQEGKMDIYGRYWHAHQKAKEGQTQKEGAEKKKDRDTRLVRALSFVNEKKEENKNKPWKKKAGRGGKEG